MKSTSPAIMTPIPSPRTRQSSASKASAYRGGRALFALLAVGQRGIALTEDSLRAAAADLRIELRIDEPDGARVHREKVVPADFVDQSAVRQYAQDLFVRAIEVKRATEPAPAARFVREHLGARKIDEIHA